MDGYTTMRFSVVLTAEQQNVYAMAGTGDDNALSAPAAYQCTAPFGADIGGTNPAFFPILRMTCLKLTCAKAKATATFLPDFF